MSPHFDKVWPSAQFGFSDHDHRNHDHRHHRLQVGQAIVAEGTTLGPWGKLGRKASRCEDDVSKKHFQQLSWQLMLSYFCNFIKFQLVASFVSLFLGVGGWVREKLIYLLLCKRQWAGHGQVGGT